MCSMDSDIPSKVKDFVAAIISKNGLNESSDVKYNPGMKPGDGFSSITYAVDITDGEKTLHIFVKCPREFNNAKMFSLYVREVLFYSTIYPTYLKFMEDKSVYNGLSSVPKCYGTNEEHALLALENLRTAGFTLFNRNKYMNDCHLKLVLRSLAKFHAVSFAMKDQQKEIHDKFCEQCPYLYRLLRSLGFEKMASKILEEFMSKLDSIQDQDLLARYQGLGATVEDVYLNLPDRLSEYSILTKGDCWINNMMFLYEDKNEDYLKDLALVDWQCVTRGSPVYDIAPVFYSGATKEAMDNYKHYLQIYYKELCDRIRELGSDPEVLYPYSVFEKEWKGCGLYALPLAMLVVKVLVRTGEDVPELDINAPQDTFANLNSNDEVWITRAKDIARHFIDIGSV